MVSLFHGYRRDGNSIEVLMQLSMMHAVLVDAQVPCRSQE
jgi:hypothetical protein